MSNELENKTNILVFTPKKPKEVVTGKWTDVPAVILGVVSFLGPLMNSGVDRLPSQEEIRLAFFSGLVGALAGMTGGCLAEKIANEFKNGSYSRSLTRSMTSFIL